MYATTKHNADQRESSALSIKISVYVLYQAAVGQGMAHIEALKSDGHTEVNPWKWKQYSSMKHLTEQHRNSRLFAINSTKWSQGPKMPLTNAMVLKRGTVYIVILEDTRQ